MSKDGFDNETLIVEALNEQRFSDLTSNMQKLITSLYPTIQEDDTIKAEKLGTVFKSDIEVVIKNNIFYISVKKGSGNSVHQEPISEFISYIKTKLSADYHICQEIENFIWGDGTPDGSGQVSDRLSAREIKKLHPKRIATMQEFFDINCTVLLKRFLETGSTGHKPAEFIYYGDLENGHLVPIQKAIDFLCKNPLKNNPHVGGLSFQAWNRNINGGDKSEKKRGQIQLKWGNLASDIIKIYNE